MGEDNEGKGGAGSARSAFDGGETGGEKFVRGKITSGAAKKWKLRYLFWSVSVLFSLLNFPTTHRSNAGYIVEGKYGKAKVKVLRIIRHTEFYHDLTELEVECLLEGLELEMHSNA